MFTQWEKYCHGLGIKDLNIVYDGWHLLKAGYDAPNRKHHNFRHIEESLNYLYLDKIQNMLSKRESNIVECVIWFHDVWYDGKSLAGRNESISKILAIGWLKSTGVVDAKFISLVGEAIESTKDHRSGNFIQMVVSDIDLAILGQPWERFLEFEEAIREEYSWASEDDYKKGRLRFINSMFNRGMIYYTNYFYWQLEGQAKSNLIKLRKQLS